MSARASITYGDQIIEYQINPDPRRNSRIAIHVEPDGQVIVDAPPGYAGALVQRAVARRARWIAGHVNAVHARFRHVHPRSYVSGEQALYLGRRYVLKVIEEDDARGTARLRANRLEVRLRRADPQRVRAILRGWYRTRARDYFARMIDRQSAALPWIERAPPFRLLEMSRRWGSCSTRGQLILNPHLIKAPRPAIAYVILHELVHLKHHDHSPAFFALLNRHAPGWERDKAALDQMVEVLVNA